MLNQVHCPIPDVRLRPLLMHHDTRGNFTEVFRACWENVLRPVQWSVLHSTPNVLRGVHVHLRHMDYVVVLTGEMLFGLCDLREESPTHGTGCLLEMDAKTLTAVEIPPGVAHGFYSPGVSLLLHGASEYFDPADNLEFRWNDPGLHIPWPDLDPILSLRDQQSGSVAEQIAQLRSHLVRTEAGRKAA